VMGLPWYIVPEDMKRQVYLNNAYDRELETVSESRTADQVDKRAASMLNGQGHDVTGRQSRNGLARKENPQNKTPREVADDFAAKGDVIHY